MTTVTAEMIAEVRRLVNEPTATVYSDALITSFIEKYPTVDELGTNPYYWTQGTGVPVKVYNTNWIPTYNLFYASSDIWQEKAASIADRFDFSADGGSYSRSQAYDQAMGMSRLYRSRGGIKTFTTVKYPDEPISGVKPSWIGNLSEDNY